MTYQYTIPIQLGLDQTGLTLTAQQYNPVDGTDVGGPITSGFVERVLGRYDWTGDLPDNQLIGVRFLDGASELASTVINPSDAWGILAIWAKVSALNPTDTIAVNTPIDPVTGNVSIIRGDAYLLTSPKGALVWTETTGLWAPYAGLPAKFTAKNGHTLIGPVTATVAHVTGTTYTITVELRSADTNTLKDNVLGTWNYDVQSTTAHLVDETILEGILTLELDVTPASV